jgi:2-polyprenyl-3-methyl-5-hydroxy-6-metoxy-1,4-benzoquinol methylase
MGWQHDLIAYIRRKIVGGQIADLTRRIETLERREDGYRRLLESLGRDNRSIWLFLNREERMDANDVQFDEGRREFHLDRYRFACRYSEGCVVSDIASGTGYGSAMLLRDGHAARVAGIDVDPEAVDYANRTYGTERCEFECSDATATGLEAESVDLVVSFETIEHVEDDRALLDEFHRIIKPGGQLICSTPNKWPLADSPHHVREYDRREFEAVLARHFVITELFNQNSGAGAYNRGQPAGICRTTGENEDAAECFIAVCRKPGQSGPA